MSYTVKSNGDIVCDTAEEAVALARHLRASAPAAPAGQVVGEPITTERWQKVHATDKRITAAVDRLKAGQEFFGDLTPLQRQACEMRIAGKWPAEIGKELGRTTGTIQAIIWDAQKRLARRAAGERLPTQAEIASMGGRAAAEKRRAAAETSAVSPSVEEAKQEDPVPAPEVGPRKQRLCRKCGERGHYAKKCLNAARDLTGPEPVPAPVTAAEITTTRDEYAARFYPHIEHVARRLARRLPAHVEIDDLISAGMTGLMEAAARFDPARGQNFEAFADFRIRGAMIDDMRSRDTLSRDMRRISNELREATSQLEAQLGRTPDHEEIAKHLGISIDELHERQQKLSGSSVIAIDDAGPDLLERTADQSSDDPFEIAARREMMHKVATGIGELPERMQQVLLLYYCKDLNLHEIGAVMGVSESRVCQIHRQATAQLRDNLGILAA